MVLYPFPALQTYSPLSAILAVKIITLSLLVCGQDEQVSGMDQLYTGSGEDDTVQLSITSSLTFTNTVWFCLDNNFGGPVWTIMLPMKQLHNLFHYSHSLLCACANEDDTVRNSYMLHLFTI